jgi:PEP-CTERM motif
MNKKGVVRLLCAGSLLVSPALGHALTGITDNPNDFLTTFAGSSSSTDLDVLSATVLYDASTDQFRLTATMGGPIGTTPTSLYVWGVNRGAGTAGFAANGIDGVRFDRVILLDPDGTSMVAGAGPLPSGALTVSGNSVSAVVSGSLLPSTGFNKLDYTWNLWPRDVTFSGFAQIADFAPDNASFTTTPGSVPVPEPGAHLLMLAGLAVAGWMLRRRAAA